jgi:hypothetical protein
LIFVWHFISLHFFIVIGLFFSSFAMFPWLFTVPRACNFNLCRLAIARKALC